MLEGTIRIIYSKYNTHYKTNLSDVSNSLKQLNISHTLLRICKNVLGKLLLVGKLIKKLQSFTFILTDFKQLQESQVTNQ